MKKYVLIKNCHVNNLYKNVFDFMSLIYASIKQLLPL